jgi:hypothetical protein
MARNAFGSTLMGEFFYNEGGSLDGNEVMRQYLKVSTGAAIVGLTTIGLVSDMGGGNERFFTLLNDGRKIKDNDMWPIDNVTFKNPLDPSSDVHTAR